MKLLRDVVRHGSYDDDESNGGYMAMCNECGWHYSRRAWLSGRIMHHYNCSMHNRNGIDE